jgi:methionine--tRNA ligase beta chain
VLRPLRLVIENFPEERVEWLQAPNHPEDPAAGTRQLPLSRVVWVERDDFLEDPPRQWFRLAPGREVRLRYACLVRCREVVKDAASGEVVELRCTWDPESLGGTSPDGRVVRGTLHWVSAAHAIPAEARLYDRLFSRPNPADVAEGESFLDSFNRESLLTLTSCQLEPGLAGAAAGSRFQLERLGYFCIDPDSAPGRLVLNRTVTLRDTWAKIAAKLGPGPSREAETAAATAPSVADSAAPPAGAAAGATTPTALAPTADPTAHPPTPPTAGPATAPAGRPGLHPLAPEITIEDFGRLDLRVGLVCSAETVAGAKKLLRLEVDLGEGRRRQIFAGIRHSYPDPARLVGMRVVVLANLKPRQMKWGLSEGMVLAGGAEAHGHFVATLDSSGEGPSPGDRVT